jgi:hypothetical protein
LYAPKIRVKFGDAVLKSAASNEDPNIVTIESEGSIKVQVPTIELAASEQIRNVLVFVSIDNSVLHPPLGLTFTIFPQPVIRKWFPLYGLFETETRVTITGTRFTDTGEARCRFVGATCASEDGKAKNACVPMRKHEHSYMFGFTQALMIFLSSRSLLPPKSSSLSRTPDFSRAFRLLTQAAQ